jgi:hypothetical protein
MVLLALRLPRPERHRSMAAHLPRILKRRSNLPQAVSAGALIGPAQVFARIVRGEFSAATTPLLSTRLACLTHPIGAAIVMLVGGAAARVAIFHGTGNGILTIARGTLPWRSSAHKIMAIAWASSARRRWRRPRHWRSVC